MSRNSLIEARARHIALARFGNADLWTVCISEASQSISMHAIRQRDQQARAA